MATVNEDLFDRAVSHQIGLHRVATGTVRKIIALLNRTDKDLVRKIERRGGTSGRFTTLRLQRLLQDIREVNREAYARVHAAVREDLVAVAKYEADFQARALSTTIPVEVELTKPMASTLRAIVTAKPFEGALLKEWVAGMERGRFTRMRDAVRIGIVEGETVDQMVRRIRGTAAQNYRDGVLEISRRSAESMVRTAVNHVTTQARETLYEENKDIVKGVRWVSTLDNRTTPICRARDGKVYKPNEGPRPPAHINCRSTTVPVTKSWKELGIDLEEAPAGTRASMDGQVPANLTYDEWLRKQSPARQNDVLGRKRADLFRAGMTVDRFVDPRGKSLTLAELSRVETEAIEVVRPQVGKIEYTGGESEQFKRVMEASYNSVPEKVRQQLVDGGVSIKSGAMLTDVRPDLKGVQPRGWTAGSTWDNAEGLYSKNQKTAVVSEFFLDRATGERRATARASGVLKHELGHALDDVLGWASHKPEFRAVYLADVATIDPDTRRSLDYLLQPGDAGPEEAFAELFAQVLSGGRGGYRFDIRGHFPRTVRWLKRILL